jgi:hypothetical protein
MASSTCQANHAKSQHRHYRATANKTSAISAGNNTHGLTLAATVFSGTMVAYVE